MPDCPSDRKHFEQMTVWILEVEASSAASMVDRHVVGRERSAAIGKTLVPDPLKYPVELSVAHLEGIVLPIEGRARSKSSTNVSFTRTGAKCEAAPS